VIAALEKAQSLHRFAESQGSPLSSFILVLSDTEALELLDWFKAEHEASELYDLDLEKAHKTGDPWEMLPEFNLMGFAIARVEQLN
jgi:hypothetical protein